MTTLREAAQMALDSMLHFSDDISDDMFESIKALRAALAQPEQEPKKVIVLRGQWDKVVAIYRENDEEIIRAEMTKEELFPVPPQREWFGLTNKELTEIIGISSADSDWNVLKVINWAKAIEAKLKEKNT